VQKIKKNRFYEKPTGGAVIFTPSVEVQSSSTTTVNPTAPSRSSTETPAWLLEIFKLKVSPLI
jgi:hypothetical protein